MNKFLSKFSYILSSQSVLFLLIVLFEFFSIVFLTMSHRIGIHDTFFCFYSSYYFLNNVVISGEIPLWIPYLTHGVPSSFLFAVQGATGIFVKSLLLTGGVLKNSNFLDIFNYGIFFDKLVLLVGTWLLSSCFYRENLTKFFVSSTMMATSIWVSQIFYNFHFYYAIPLLLYFFHSFIDSGKWRYVFLFVNLYVVQFLDKVAYFHSILSLILFLYVFYYICFYWKYCCSQFKKIKWSVSFLMCLVGSLGSFLVLFLLVQKGNDPFLAKDFVSRQTDGTVSMDVFLNYAVNTKVYLAKWIEVFLGFSPDRDYTLYMGVLTLMMIVFSFRRKMSRQALVIIGVIVTIYFVSTGSILAQIFYYTWPFMKYFRHLPLLTPIMRIFLIFLAGFGFERVLYFLKKDESYLSKLYLGTISIIFLVLGIFLYLKSQNIYFLKDILNAMAYSESGKNLTVLGHLNQEFAFNAMIFILCAVFLGVFGIVKNKFWKAIILAIILMIHVYDVYSYSYSDFLQRTHKIDQSQYDLNTFQSMPFRSHRSKVLWEGSDRVGILSEELMSRGQNYWVVDAYLFVDQVGTLMKTEYWLKPWGQYLKAYWNQSVDNLEENPLGFQLRMIFPSDHIGARKFSGLDENKIQVFSKAYVLKDAQQTADVIANDKYQGDMLFVMGEKQSCLKECNWEKWNDQYSLATSDRIRTEYEVLDFSANHLKVKVDISENNAWMFYSDVWHPDWNVFVNGQKRNLYKANLAYKAVRLEKGENIVHFVYHPKMLSFLIKMISFNSLFWVFFVLVMSVRILVVRSKETGC